VLGSEPTARGSSNAAETHTNLGHMAQTTAPRNRSPYQNTAVSLMRTGVLDAMCGLLRERKWSSITMADVSTAAGISRGTLYNEFGSRRGLARGYALRLADDIVTGMETAIHAHPADGYAALQSTFRGFFNRIDTDPLVGALRTEDAPNDLLRMITVESQFIVDHAAEKLSGTFQHSWVGANHHDANVLAQAIVRASLSFLALPPAGVEDAATTMAHLLTPYIEAIRTPS
jgi:AcrR family transcriptional regulator